MKIQISCYQALTHDTATGYHVKNKQNPSEGKTKKQQKIRKSRSTARTKASGKNGKKMKTKQYQKTSSNSEERASIRNKCNRSPATVEGGQRRKFLGETKRDALVRRLAAK